MAAFPMNLMQWWQTACFLCKAIRYMIQFGIALIIFSFSVFGALTLFQWAGDTAPAIETRDVGVDHETAQPGDILVFSQHVTKYRDCPGRIVHLLSGDCGYHILVDRDSTLAAGFDGKVNYVVRIPFEALPGQCAFSVKMRYECNPFDWFLQRQVYQSDPIPFTVLPFKEDN